MSQVGLSIKLTADAKGVRAELAGAQTDLTKLAAAGKGGAEGLAKVGQSADKTAQSLAKTATAAKTSKDQLDRTGLSARSASRTLDTTNGTARGLAATMDGQVSNAFRRAAQSTAALNGPLGGVSGRLSSLSTIAGTTGLALGGLSLAVGGFAIVMNSAVAVAERMEKAGLKTEAVLRATGQASGQTSEGIRQMAREIGLATLASTEGVEAAAQVLLTFRSVSGDTFRRTLELSQDLAEVGFGSIESGAVQLGKALEDPAQGLTALTRVGVTFSEKQKEMIKTLHESGQVLEAQRLILDAVEQQVGGAGTAAAGGLSGAIDTLGQRWSEFLETVADRAGALASAAAGVNLLSRALEGLSDLLSPATTQQALSSVVVQYQATQRAVEGLEQRHAGEPANSPGQQRLAAARQRLEALRAEYDALGDVVVADNLAASARQGSATQAAAAAQAEAALQTAQAGAAAMSLSLASAEEKATTARAERLRQIDGWVKAGLDEATATGLRAKAEDAYRAAMDKAAEAGKKKNKVTEQAASKLDALMQAQQDDLRMAGLSVEARAEEEAVLRASEAARQDYKEGLRDTPLLYAAEVEAIKQTVTATRTVTAERKAASEVAREAARESERAWKDYARDVAKTAEDISGDVSEALWDSMTDERAGQSALEWFKDWGRRLGIEMLKQNIILPITAQVVGSMSGAFGIETPAGAAAGAAGSGAGMAGDAMSLGSLFANGGQSTMLRGIGSSIALSGAGQSLGLSTGAAAAGSFRAAQEVGMASAGSTLTSSGSLLADGLGSSPWGIVGSLGAKALGLGSGNAMIDGAAGMVGSIGGGMAGSALMGAQLGAAAGPIGAAIGAFIAIAASTLLKSSPTNAAAGVRFDPRSGEIASASHAGKGNSEENLKALTDGVVPAVTLATQALTRAGVVTRESITSMNFGNRDTTSFGLSGGAMGTRTVSTGTVGDPVDLVGDIIQALIDGADAVPDAIAERLHLLDFSDPEGLVASIEFIGGFEDAIAAMTRGTVDFAGQLEAVAKQEIAQATAAVTKFQAETARLGLDTQAAADATRAYVEQLIGLREPAAAMSATEQAVAGVHARFAALGPLLQAVGMTAEDAARGLEKALGAIAEGFDTAIAREIAAKTDPTGLALRDLGERFQALRREAVAVGGSLDQVHRLYALEQAAITAPQEAARAEAEQQRVQGLLADVMTAYESQAQGLQTVADAMGGAARSLREAWLSLALDGSLSPLSPEDRMAEAERQYNDVLGRARLGSSEAMGQLPEIARSYLEVARGYRGDTAEYSRIFDEVTAALQDTETVAARHARIADEQLSVMRQQLDALGLLNTTALSLADALAAYQAAVSPAAAAANDNASLSARVTSFAALQDQVSRGDASINERAAAYLRDNPDVAADSGFGNIAGALRHFMQHGQYELRGFSSGGTTRDGELVKVHHGELLYTGPRTEVFNARDTDAILGRGRGRAEGGDNRDVVAGLRDLGVIVAAGAEANARETRALRAEMARVAERLRFLEDAA